MAETLYAYRIVSGKISRWEATDARPSGEHVRYPKGAIIQLTARQAARFGAKLRRVHVDGAAIVEVEKVSPAEFAVASQGTPASAPAPTPVVAPPEPAEEPQPKSAGDLRSPIQSETTVSFDDGYTLNPANYDAPMIVDWAKLLGESDTATAQSILEGFPNPNDLRNALKAEAEGKKRKGVLGAIKGKLDAIVAGGVS